MTDNLVLPDAEAMVRQYLACRAYIDAETAALAERLKPYQEAMTTLEACAALLMQQTKQRALSTQAGTAFPKTHLSVTCENRDAWLDFVWEQAASAAQPEDVERAWSGVTNHIAKEFVETWMETHEGRPPPGVKVVKIVKIQFRKA